MFTKAQSGLILRSQSLLNKPSPEILLPRGMGDRVETDTQEGVLATGEGGNRIPETFGFQ